jgi:hypothetical protein
MKNCAIHEFVGCDLVMWQYWVREYSEMHGLIFFFLDVSH